MSEQNNGLAASPSDWPKALFAVALLFSIFQIITAAFHPVSTQVLRAVHVGFLLLLVFISFRRSARAVRGSPRPGCWVWLAWLRPSTSGTSRRT